jgi:D-amino-acid oxidase
LKERAVVVGCGIAGLASAHRLLERGFEVSIWTRDLPPRTTSSVAGAIWYPYKVAPAEKVAPWAHATYAELEVHARFESSGVVMRDGVELLPIGAPKAAVAAAAQYRKCARKLRELHPECVPAGFERGFEMQVPIAEMPLYLDFLLRRFLERGGRLVERTIASFDEPLDAAPLVVNCTGLASRELANDRELRAIRGQVLRVERGDIERFTLDDMDSRGVTYVIPRSKDCILGGTTDEGAEELVPDEAATKSILARCTALEPKLANARVLSVAVGLRPARSAVRLERETRGSRTLIHNYGHGGAGLTLAWGCADDVAVLASSVATRS